MFFIYIIYSEKADKFYIGYSNNPWKRLDEHNTSEHITFTSKYRPWLLKAIFEVGENEIEAIKLERYLKMQHSRKLIERLTNPDYKTFGQLAQLVRVPHVRD
jgi:putative endonuclease